MTSRTLYLNSAHRICSSGHLLEILPFICWGPTTNRRDNHKLENLFEFQRNTVFFTQKKDSSGHPLDHFIRVAAEVTSYTFFFLQTRFVQFIKKRHNKSPIRYQERYYASHFEQRLRSNFTHTQHHTLIQAHHTLTHKQVRQDKCIRVRKTTCGRRCW